MHPRLSRVVEVIRVQNNFQVNLGVRSEMNLITFDFTNLLKGKLFEIIEIYITDFGERK